MISRHLDSQKIKGTTFLYIFCFIYPIIPLYFGIFQVSAFNLMCLFFVASYAFMQKVQKAEIRTEYGIQLVIIFWIIIFALINLYHSDFTTYIYELLDYVIAGYVVVRLINSDSKFIKAIDCIILGASIVAAFGIIESFSTFNIFESLNNLNSIIVLNPLRFGQKRIVSFTFQTISYCSYCMFVLALIFYRITLIKHKNGKVKYQIAYVLVSINSILTLSRSLMLCTLLCQILLLFKCGYKTWVKPILQISGLAVVSCIILFMVSKHFFNIFQSVVYMLLAAFDEKYAMVLGDVDGTGIGDRANLYIWVWESIKGHLVLGLGKSTNFAYSYLASNGADFYLRTKTSIENQYLNLLYHYGFLGMISEIILYIGLLWHCWKQKHGDKAPWEGKLSFNSVCFITFLCYFISFFGVHQIDEKRIFCLFIFFLLAYTSNYKFIKESNRLAGVK
ncbi:MAG TPA: hypothetical protein DDW65_25570 [Firmicutes bacterium]|jgi:hypothetical protein|nr:hypothetical protein [Bacillota bacterium]